MKKHLKIISLLSLFIVGITTFFIFAKRPADDKPETIMVKSHFYPLSKSDIEIFYGGDKIEISNPKNSDLDQSVLSIIQKLNSEGYKVISQSEYSFGANGYSHEGTWVLNLK